jgi:hypothetical protein
MLSKRIFLLRLIDGMMSRTKTEGQLSESSPRVTDAPTGPEDLIRNLFSFLLVATSIAALCIFVS